MSDDDNALKDVDLSAWDVPAPERSAEELADDVIAVAGGTDIGAAIPVEGPVSTRKRAMLIAGVAAAVIALTAGTWVIVRGAKHAAPRDGSVIAEKAQALELDAAHADLDPGADVRWTRKGSVLRVEQRAGSAAWHVGSDSKLVIEAGTPGAALASVDASGASLRVEVKPMNAADIKIAGAVATTAATVALVTVVVYEGHVKVRDNGTQQTVIVQPGTTYTVTPRPAPMPIVDDDSTFDDDDDAVVGVAPVGPDQPPEVRIVAGDDVFIHDMSPPSRVKIDMTKACRNGKVDLVVNGVSTSSGDTLAFNRGNMKYSVLCDDVEVTGGSVVVSRDSLVRPLPQRPPVNLVNADGRKYAISFQQMPAVQVNGGPGTLHVASGSVERTYETRSDSVLIPSTDLTQGEYKMWFTPDVMTTVSFSLDTTAPIVSVTPISWGPQLTLEGETLPGSVLTVEGIGIPVAGNGRFKAVVPGGGDILVMRIDHAQAGMHYAIARNNIAAPTPTPTPVTVSQSPGMLDRSSITKTMSSLKSRFLTCSNQHPQSVRTTVKAKVFVEPNGRVSKTELVSTADPKLNVCLNDVISSATFPGASQQTVFSYPIIIEPPPAKVLPPGNCDADALKDKGMDSVNLGQHAAALAYFEASLRCKQDSYVDQLAFMESCNAQNEAKAELYWNKLTKAQQDKYEAICVRNHINIRKLTSRSSSSDTDLAPANCDAEALKDKGMQNIDLGQHAKALALFEQSLACKNDAFVVALAFMAACSAQDVQKSRKYYAKLTPPMQEKYKVMCIRNHIDPSQPSDDFDDVYDDTDAKGYLQVLSKPKAKVLVDGVDTGLTTPIKGKKLALAPGKHKITYVIGDDRFTYPVNIKPGKTELISKDLQ